MHNDLPFITREVRSRRLITVEPITFVAPAAVGVFSGVIEPVQPIRQNEFFIYLQPNNLSVYQKTDAAYYTGWGLAHVGPTQVKRNRFRSRLQESLFPIVTAVTPPTAATYPSNDLVLSIRRKETRRKFLQPVELTVYAPTISAAVYPSFVPPQAYRFKADRTFRYVAELDQWPATSPTDVMDRLALSIDSVSTRLKIDGADLQLSLNSCRDEAPAVAAAAEQGAAVNNLILPGGGDLLLPSGGVILLAATSPGVADTLNNGLTTAVHNVAQTITQTGNTYFSAYVQDADHGVAAITMEDDGGNYMSLGVDLTDGSSAGLASTGGLSTLKASIEDAGSGWYRLIIGATFAGSTVTASINMPDVSPLSGGNQADNSYEGAEAEIVATQAMMSATDIDYTTGAANLLSDPEDLSQWTNNNVIVLTNTTAAP